MRRLLNCLGLALMVMAIPAQAIEASGEVPLPKTGDQAAPPATPTPAAPPATRPNSEGDEGSELKPSQPSLKNYCREHTC